MRLGVRPEPQPRLVDERGGLERLCLGLARKPVRGEVPDFREDFPIGRRLPSVKAYAVSQYEQRNGHAVSWTKMHGSPAKVLSPCRLR